MSRSFVSPQYLRRFGELAVLIQQRGHASRGRWIPDEETRTPLTVVSAPASHAAMRDVLPEGARLSDWRQFWFAMQSDPVRIGEEQADGDAIEYQGVRYMLRQVADWGQFVEVLGVREEGQSD